MRHVLSQCRCISTAQCVLVIKSRSVHQYITVRIHYGITTQNYGIRLRKLKYIMKYASCSTFLFPIYLLEQYFGNKIGEFNR